MDENWKDNPKLSQMDRGKLDMLSQLAMQGAGKSPSELLPYIMNAAAQGKQAGMNFSGNEIDTIIQVLKAGKSPAEAQKLDQVVRLMKMIR
nr:hypothetical protein [uncultured Blautia sp.]